MNERIKQLLEQVGGHGTQALMHPDDVEKFAVLIINECATVGAPNYMSTPSEGIYYVEQSVARIKEHFGVEQ